MRGANGYRGTTNTLAVLATGLGFKPLQQSLRSFCWPFPSSVNSNAPGPFSIDPQVSTVSAEDKQRLYSWISTPCLSPESKRLQQGPGFKCCSLGQWQTCTKMRSIHHPASGNHPRRQIAFIDHPYSDRWAITTRPNWFNNKQVSAAVNLVVPERAKVQVSVVLLATKDCSSPWYEYDIRLQRRHSEAQRRLSDNICSRRALPFFDRCHQNRIKQRQHSNTTEVKCFCGV